MSLKPLKKVNVYSVTWCPHCVRAKNYLDQLGIRYVDYDVDRDEEAWKKALALTGGMDIVPVIECEGDVIYGAFNQSFESRLREILGIMQR
ncbi:MAG: glutaredoxin family protein [Candidatus Riflebacteria bacterium]|nr:glutaredoxin family protein [Candidatus Riflebacteria bacterium]